MKPAQRLQNIKTSAAIAITDHAAKLAAQGRDIIALSAGEPDFETPPYIQAAGHDAIRFGETKYTALDGTIELKTAIKDKFLRENGLHFDLNQILVTNGAKQALFNAFLATVDQEDEVIIPAPYWVSYPEMVSLSEGTPIFVRGSSSDLKISPADLEAAITPKTKWFVFNSPHNPTGAVYSQLEMKKLADVLVQHPHVHILTDDIYEHIIYGNTKFFTISQVEPKLADRTITVNGLSKTYSMTGWRIGYAAGPADIIKLMKAVQSHSTTNACSISQFAAAKALNGAQDFLHERCQSFKERRDLVTEGLNLAKGIVCNRPDGAFYVFPNCAGLIGKKTQNGSRINSDYDFVSALLDQEGVAVVHGSAFGCPEHFRVSYAASKDRLMKACTRIQRFCASLG